MQQENRQQIAKARRAVLKDGVGGMTSSRAKKKRSEQKKPASGKGFGKTTGGLNFDRRPSGPGDCACFGSMKWSPVSYNDCICSSLHDGAEAATPEDLVRARYTAFAYRLPDYLMRTTDPEGEEFDADAAKWKKGLLGFMDDFQFQKLEVVDVREGAGKIAAEGEAASTSAELAQVDFRVDFVQKGTVNLMVLCETSTFRKDAEGRWLYAQGDVTYEAQTCDLSPEEQAKLREMHAAQQAKEES